MNAAAPVVAVVALTALLVLNGIATRTVWRAANGSRGQKLAQLAIVWLLPIVGALMIFAVWRGERNGSPSAYTESREEADDVAVSHLDYGSASDND